MDALISNPILKLKIDFFKIDMNRLPKVLQNEIYEFARGDRKYWKTRFNQVIDRLEVLIFAVESEIYIWDPPMDRTKRLLVRATGPIGWTTPKTDMAPFLRNLSHINVQRYAECQEEFREKYQWMLNFKDALILNPSILEKSK